jgi:hypothetical protein
LHYSEKMMQVVSICNRTFLISKVSMLFAVFVLTKKHPMLICQQANKLRALRGYNFRTVHSPINSIECHSYIKSDKAVSP